MPTENLQDELYRKYDLVVSEILTNLMSTVDERKVLRLLFFNRKEKSNLLVLRVALMARDLYQVSVEIDCGFWDRLAINWKIRKSFGKVKKAPDFNIRGAWVPDVLDAVSMRTNYAFDFGDIYDAYYEGSCD